MHQYTCIGNAYINVENVILQKHLYCTRVLCGHPGDKPLRICTYTQWDPSYHTLRYQLHHICMIDDNPYSSYSHCFIYTV